MENAEYRALIEQMGPKESIIEHAGNILDTLLPVGGVRFLHIGRVSGRTVKTSETKSQTGWQNQWNCNRGWTWTCNRTSRTVLVW